MQVPPSPLPLPTVFQKAVALHQRGSVASAAALYREILAVAPAHPGALHLLGVIAHDAGKHDAAVAYIRQAIKAGPTNPSFHNNLATALRAQGKLDEAVASYRQAIALRPDYVEAHANLGHVLTDLGRSDAALASYRRALALSDSAEIKGSFARCIENVAPARIDVPTRGLLVRAMTEAWTRPGDLAKTAIGVLRADPHVGPCIGRAAAAWPHRLACEALFGVPGVSAVADDALLHAVLECAQISDAGMERFVTMARHAMLDAAMTVRGGDAVDGTALPFHAAIARQCFISDYVFDYTDAEMTRAERLRASLIEALRIDAAIPPAWLAALAAYWPLSSVPGSQSLPQRAWPDAIAALLAQQVSEPREEEAYRQSIPSLTAIHDDTSLAVRRQYEESPYPRWIKAPLCERPVPLDAYLRRRFPRARMPSQDAGADVDILVAGCGTGQESHEMAREVQHARVLAVDLSRTSLAYARRKAHEHALSNILYAQADILQLASAGRTFDVITASGVLHHLADPLAGLRALVSLLRPGGVMRLGLYSERARDAVVAARRFIADGGYGTDAASIRRCRQALMAAEQNRFGTLTASRDFYVMGECRDLLFHVQEHRFTLRQIDAMLRGLRLAFLGFSLKPHVLREYARRYPDDEGCTDLAHWHDFETAFPGTFAGMYQFLVHKSAPTTGFLPG